MTRERWFYAEGQRRMGPVARRELVDALLQLTDPRSCLVWRRGLQAWTPAAEVPEIDRMLATVAHADARSPMATPAPVAPPAEAPRRRVATPRTRPHARPEALSAVPPRRLGPFYAAGVFAVLVIGVLAWSFWPRPATSPLPPAAGGSAAPDATGAPATLPGSAVAAATPPATGGGGFAGWTDQEADLPSAELRQLRGVGGWAGDKLTVTLYNGSSWRVTEIFVLTSRMEGGRFVDSVAPHLLLPVGGAPVEGKVEDLLQKVAPDRKRPGVNPADTGPFEVVLGPQPAGYRWKIERARGYPPRIGP
jgi:hypothetical protein